MKQIIKIAFLLISFSNCKQRDEQECKDCYPENIGDIVFDKNLDDPSFKICNPDRIFQYYNLNTGLRYKGEKPKISEHFNELKTSEIAYEQSGYITIRFIINCEGKTGYFRVQQMDNNFNRNVFDVELLEKFLLLTKQLDGWITHEKSGRSVDYYQYLTFKIEKGKLIEIMP
ncbi:MAG: hypothetical protein LW721_04775 [Flammeovirgaceae bacterium]|jgi:hypothetical protein|nr:hypothetical protein [Flammeovirgaceae bacterium]